MAKNIVAAPWAWRISDQGDQPGSHNQPLIIKAKLSSLENSPHQAVFSSTAACVHASVCLCVFACAALRCAALRCALRYILTLQTLPFALPSSSTHMDKGGSPCLPTVLRACRRSRWSRTARHVSSQYNAHASLTVRVPALRVHQPHSSRPRRPASTRALLHQRPPPQEHSTMRASLH